MDQNRDGFIDKADLRDTFAALGRQSTKESLVSVQKLLAGVDGGGGAMFHK